MFYHFNQNNSGGSHTTTDRLCRDVYIEADSAEEANEILESFGGYFDGVSTGLDCGCCGDRWYRAGSWDETTLEGILEDEPENVKAYGGGTKPDTRVFCKDGTLIEYTREGSWPDATVKTNRTTWQP